MHFDWHSSTATSFVLDGTRETLKCTLMERAFQTPRTRNLPFQPFVGRPVCSFRCTPRREVALARSRGKADNLSPRGPWATLGLDSLGQQGLEAMQPVWGGFGPAPRVNPTPSPVPTAPATIATVPHKPRCGPAAAVAAGGTPGLVSLPEATSTSRVACCGGNGAE